MPAAYRFGPFELRPASQELLVEGRPASLGARAFDVLLALLERRDRLVTKGELLAIAWPGLVVEENNLQVQISALRKILGDGVIKTVSGKGYRFTAEIAGAEAATIPAVSRPAPSIAVLPFVNRSHDLEDEYFSDGLADELLNVLAKIRGLRVAARSSAFTFKGKNATVAEIGRVLNVATVLEGSVRKAANRLRISVQLVKVSDGYHLWSESYDRTLEDIFAVQDDIAQSVVKELRTTLLGEAADATAERAATAAVAAAAKGRATDPEALQLYLQARYVIVRDTREDTTKSIGFFKEALARDPEFAMAWVELGMAYMREADRRWAPVVEGYGRAREAVLRALALEPELAEGHAALGLIQMDHDWDWRGAEASCRRALALAPGSALVLRRAAIVIGSLGHPDEAIELCQRALAQDPLSAVAYGLLAVNLNGSGRLTDAEAAHRKALELAPQRTVTHAQLALNLLAQGRGEEALAEAQQEPEQWARLRSRAIIHHAAGRRAGSEAALQELIAKHQGDSAYQVAEVYAARGEPDLAFAWLERAYEQRDPWLSEIKAEPLFRSLHADPRWGAFLRKMGFAD
jgi:TolB-like protein/Tfp pilus assembly protein PilF